MRNPTPRHLLYAVAVAAALSGSAAAADTPLAQQPAPSQHRLMKECMAKQRAANSGLPKEDMKKACKDVTQTEKQNDDAARKRSDSPASTP